MRSRHGVSSGNCGPLHCTTLWFMASSPCHRSFPSRLLPACLPFINGCCGVRLHSVTSRGHCSPKGARGAAQLQLQQGSVHGHVSNVCFLFPLCLFGRSGPCSSPTVCATGTLSHIYPHRKAYCTLNKHFLLLQNENRIQTGVLHLVLSFRGHGIRLPLLDYWGTHWYCLSIAVPCIPVSVKAKNCISWVKTRFVSDVKCVK